MTNTRYPCIIAYIAIRSFRDRATEDVYHGVNSKDARKIDRRVWGRVAQKLDMLDAAIRLSDLKSPGNQLEKLKGGLEGYWSIRVNDQYRIVFQFEEGTADKVFCEDIH
ncbi:MAG TPA: type II toxin-antitoxin system RelE/ParE family toxin [Terriglobales bacterium]|nr:type II toxin-antitoxin system RelE/ParE family toxin [Terriglobales bacterium]